MLGNNRTEDKYNTFLCVAVLLPYLVLVTELLFTSFFEASFIRLLGKGLIGIYFAFVLFRYFKRIITKAFFIYLSFIILFLLQLLFYPSRNNIIIDIVSYFLIICLPICIFSSEITDAKVFLNCSKVISYIMTIVGCIVVLFSSNNSSEYNMSLGYYMLFPCLVFLNCIYKREKSVWNYLSIIISFGIVLSLGSRGPILCIAIYIIIKELSYINIRHKIKLKKLVLVSIRVLLIAFVCAFYMEIAKAISDFFDSIGISSRTMDMVLKGELTYLSNRDRIYSWSLEKINENLLFGHGIGFSIQEKGTYCHNIILELALENGVFVCFFLVMVGLIIIWYRMHNSNSLWKEIILIWISVGIVPLFVSGLYWTNMQFWCCIGLLLFYKRKLIFLSSPKGLE